MWDNQSGEGQIEELPTKIDEDQDWENQDPENQDLENLAPAILRPCTPLYAHVRPVRPQITPSTPSTPMGVHGRTLYAHKKFVRPHNCTPMGVHGRTCTPTKKSQQFFVGVQCTPMYTHVHPCTPMGVHLCGRTNFLSVYNVRPCTPT